MHWFAPFPLLPTRFRIRAGRDEEFALPMGATVIGRDASCPISLADSVASRRHARIECDGERATLEDLDSRNGTRINDVPVSGPHTLRAGDRIGIGASELVFSIVDHDATDWRGEPTGVLAVCTQCRHCFAASAGACPRCGASAGVVSKPTDAAPGEDTSPARWTVGMLVEMVGKAMLQQNAGDADKLMRRTAIVVGDQLQAGGSLSADELRALEEAARWIDKAQRDRAWSAWCARVRTQLQAT